MSLCWCFNNNLHQDRDLEIKRKEIWGDLKEEYARDERI